MALDIVINCSFLSPQSEYAKMAQLPDRPGPQLILKMINDAQGTSYTIENVSFGFPEVSSDPTRDTQISVTFTGGILGGTTKVFYYNRLDLALLLSQWNMSFVDNGSFNNVSDALTQINSRCNLHLTMDDLESGTFELGTFPATLPLIPQTTSLVLLSTSVAQFTVLQSEVNVETLILNLSYVDEQSPAFSSFIAYVNQARDNGPSPDFSALDAAYAYRITGDESYRTLAISIVDAEVTAAEVRIANNLVPVIANDSYLEVGPRLTALSVVYAWCEPTSSQQTRWAAYAERAIGNLSDHQNAYWGVTPAPWSGWSVNDPGNNYYYSFCIATATWALASGNTTLLTYLDEQKLNPLRTYMANMLGGGSREGTGYGVSLMSLFDLYIFWRDSGQPELANFSGHLTGSIFYWVHATLPTLDRYCPIGDLSRESYPNLFDYHRSMMLKARELTTSQEAKDTASWWLNNISVQTMQQGWQRKYNLLPAGNYTLPPTDLSYRAEGAGCLFARTSWATDAVYCHFLAGTYDQSHAHQAQGSFVFFRNDFEAVTSNIYSDSGIANLVTNQNVLRFNRANNSLIPQTYGEAVMSSNTNDSDGNFYAIATLTNIMNDSSIELWRRDMVFQSGVLNILDRYTVNSGTTATFQICTPTLPVLNGNVLTVGDLQVIMFDPYLPTVNIVDMTLFNADFNSSYRVDIGAGEGRYEIELRSIAHSGSGAGANARPIFNLQPVDDTIISGGSATFTVGAVGPGSITYLWEMKTNSIWEEVGDYDTELTLTGMSGAAAGWRIRCKATNANGTTTSREVRAIIQLDTPQITVQPTDQTVFENGNATLSVTATAQSALTYNWQRFVNDSWSSQPNGNAATFNINNLSLTDNSAQFRVLVNSTQDQTISDTVTITVTPAGGLTIPDFMLRTTAAAHGAAIAQNLFPGGNGYTLEALVYIDAGSPANWGNNDILMQAVFASGRLHVVRSSNDFLNAQIQVHNNTTMNVTRFVPSSGTLYLLTFSSDTGANMAGMIRATMQEVNNPAAPLLMSIQHKGEFFGTVTPMQQLAVGAAGLNGNGWDTGLRFQWVRCFNTYRTQAQIEADRTSVDPAGSMFWWEFSDNGAGGVAVADLSGNNRPPTYVQGTIAVFA